MRQRVGRTAGAICGAALALVLSHDGMHAAGPDGPPRQASLTGRPGNADNGRALALARERGNCGACHAIPGAADTTASSMGPSLQGVARRLAEDQMRYLVVDPRRYRPATIMPAYHRTEGLVRVARALEGKPVLSADETEDVVAFLMTLRE
ncbi:MAG: sulfur oxidation c-type cytochrome SoxX [Hyphomicrobiales bacterium]|nr:MAG: sulfur oxidation c-type cytochrome SoxX [Hyphomicrobiales bacterium]